MAIKRLDLSAPLSAQSPLDALLLKVTDEYAHQARDQRSAEIVRVIEGWVQLWGQDRPLTRVIDLPQHQARTTDRVALAQLSDWLVAQRQLTASLTHAKSVPVQRGEEHVLAELRWPIMCKPLQASGSSSAHDMSILFSPEQVRLFLEQHDGKYLLQEFIPHNATIFKIYVINNTSHVVKRPSFPNLDTFGADHAPVRFDSQAVKHVLPPELTAEYQCSQPAPADHVIDQISHAIMQYFGISLFGYDLITDIRNNKHVVIDVNFFPGKYRSIFSTVPALSASIFRLQRRAGTARQTLQPLDAHAQLNVNKAMFSTRQSCCYSCH